MARVESGRDCLGEVRWKPPEIQHIGNRKKEVRAPVAIFCFQDCPLNGLKVSIPGGTLEESRCRSVKSALGILNKNCPQLN